MGGALLFVGGAVAAVVVGAGKAGVPQAYLAYGATFLWALFGVVANQYPRPRPSRRPWLCSAPRSWGGRSSGDPGAARSAPRPFKPDPEEEATPHVLSAAATPAKGTRGRPGLALVLEGLANPIDRTRFKRQHPRMS